MAPKTNDATDIARANARDPTPWMMIALAALVIAAVAAGAAYLL